MIPSTEIICVNCGTDINDDIINMLTHHVKIGKTVKTELRKDPICEQCRQKKYERLPVLMAGMKEIQQLAAWKMEQKIKNE
jgi:hypothetical protein